MEKMRDAYRDGDAVRLKKLFVMGQWMLSDEDKEKIAGAIAKLEGQPYTPPTPKQHNNPLIDDALRLLGGKIVN